MKLALTFDDDYLNQWARHVASLPKEFKATFFISGIDKIVASDGGIEALQSMVAAGHELGHHTVNHECAHNWVVRDGKGLESWWKNEILDADACWESTGITPKVFSFPFGTTTPELTRRLRERYSGLRGFTWFPKDYYAEHPEGITPAFAMDDDVTEENEVWEIIREHLKENRDLVLAGHCIGFEREPWLTPVNFLKELISFCEINDIELVHFSEIAR